MFCPKCGNEVNEGSAFCPNCGTKLDAQPSNNQLQEQKTVPIEQSTHSSGGREKKQSNFGKFVVAIVFFLLLFLLAVLFLPKALNSFGNGKIVRDEAGRLYYLDKSGNRVYNSWISFNNDEYYSDDAGFLKRGDWVGNFYVNDEGKKVKRDWAYWANAFYYLKDDGQYAKDDILKIDGKYYAFQESGAMISNVFFLNPKRKDKISYADVDGSMKFNDWYRDPVTGNFYYLDKDGYLVSHCIYEVDGKKYAFDEQGVLILYRFFNDFTNPSRYRYASETGELVLNEGFIQFNGATFFIDKDGYGVFGAWILYNGSHYFLTTSGILARSTWIERTYYVDHDGKMLFSTTTPDGYQVDASGRIIGKLRSVKSNNYTLKFVSSDVSEYPKIKLYYKIYDKNGNVKSDFNAGEITVEERDGTGAYVAKAVTVGDIIQKKYGLNVSMIVDRSTSLSSNDLTKIKSSMKKFINTMDFTVGDQCEIISFGNDITDVCKFTNNVATLTNSVDTISLSGSTALYDAVYRGISHASLQSGARCAVVFTDGYDNYSRNKLSDVINYSNARQVPVYVIGVGNSVSKADLQNLANSTGGRYWGIDNTGELSRVYDSVYSEGKSTYYIEYIADAINSSQYSQRDVHVKIDDGVEYVELSTNFAPVDSSLGSTMDYGNSSNNNNTSSNGMSSINTNSKNGYTLSYADTITDTLYYGDDDDEVSIKIRQPKISGPDASVVSGVNDALESAMEELTSWCDDYVSNASSRPRSIAFNTSSIETANSFTIVIRMKGKITGAKSSGSSDISFLFNYDIGNDSYSFYKS